MTASEHEAPPANPNMAPGDLERVRRFVNSVNIEEGTDRLSTVEGLDEWLDEYGFGAGPSSQSDFELSSESSMAGSSRLSEGDRLKAIAFREALRNLLEVHHGEPLTSDSVDALNAALTETRLRPSFVGDAIALLGDSGDSPVDALLGGLVAIVHSSMIEGTWPRLKVCPADDCRWAFYDHSKNRSGKWCSMAVCGNRSKARAYRRRADPNAN